MSTHLRLLTIYRCGYCREVNFRNCMSIHRTIITASYPLSFFLTVVLRRVRSMYYSGHSTDEKTESLKNYSQGIRIQFWIPSFC